MAVTYGFYNSVNGDRKYDALQMSQIFDGIINDGIFYSVGNRFAVTPSSGMVISVGSGRAWFNHTWTYNDAAITLTVSTAPIGSLKRIDAVVIEVNENNRVNTIKMVNGTAASTPARPSLTNSGGIHQYALAYITVDADVTSIVSGKIASVVGTDTPFVTGPIQTVSVTSLYDYWATEFEEWFETLEHVLDGDQALNLQNQINTINGTLSDVVTDLDEVIHERSKNLVIEKITTSCTWTAPKAVGQSFRIYGVGGGGAGSTGGSAGGGGGGGYVNIQTVTIPQNTNVTVTCGAGGVYNSSSNYTNGGNSTFGSYLTANGGKTSTSLNGGAGGAGGGGAGTGSSGATAGSGGAGGTYGGGGGGGSGCGSGTTPSSAGVGGAGGTYGGGGGGGGNARNSTRKNGGAGGTYGGAGGAGGSNSTYSGSNGSAGTAAHFSAISDLLLMVALRARYGALGGTAGTGTTAGTSVSCAPATGGGGGGGYGSIGGSSGSRICSTNYSPPSGGGGGGGYGGNGGYTADWNSGQTSSGYCSVQGGGGGGNYFGDGGSLTAPPESSSNAYGGGGGGGLFAHGGNVTKTSVGGVKIGGGGAGIWDVEDDTVNGTSGGFYILYYKEA